MPSLRRSCTNQRGSSARRQRLRSVHRGHRMAFDFVFANLPRKQHARFSSGVGGRLVTTFNRPRSTCGDRNPGRERRPKCFSGPSLAAQMELHDQAQVLLRLAKAAFAPSSKAGAAITSRKSLAISVAATSPCDSLRLRRRDGIAFNARAYASAASCRSRFPQVGVLDDGAK